MALGVVVNVGILLALLWVKWPGRGLVGSQPAERLGPPALRVGTQTARGWAASPMRS